MNKHLLFVTLILLITNSVQAKKGKDWQEYAVLSTGDTVRTGDSIAIISNSSVEVTKYILCKPVDAFTQEIYTIHLGAFMKGGTYEITSMSRDRVSKKPKKYTPLAEIKGIKANRHLGYYVYLEKGIAAGVIKVVKKSPIK